MAKYHVVPGGRIDKVAQGAKTVGRAARSGAGTGAIFGLMTTANSGNPLLNTAAGATVGAVAGAAKGIHHALRKDQFNK